MRKTIPITVLILTSACSSGFKPACDTGDDCSETQSCSDLGFCVDLEIGEREGERDDPEGEEPIVPEPCIVDESYSLSMAANDTQVLDFDCPNAQFDVGVEELGEARVLFEVQSEDPLSVLVVAQSSGSPTEVRLSFTRDAEEVASALMTLEVNP